MACVYAGNLASQLFMGTPVEEEVEDLGSEIFIREFMGRVSMPHIWEMEIFIYLK